MKKSILVLSFAFASVSFIGNSAIAAPSASTSVFQDDAKKEKVTAEDVPAEVVSAWTKGANAQAQISEINKVTKGQDVSYEISYAGADGTTQTAKYKADGTEVKGTGAAGQGTGTGTQGTGTSTETQGTGTGTQGTGTGTGTQGTNEGR